MIDGFNTYIRVGKIEFPRAPGVKIISQRNVPLTRFEITVPDPTGNIARATSDRDTVSIIVGYRDQDPALWEGTVKRDSVRRNKDQLVINVAGPERPLLETMIKQSFQEETPEAIIRYAVSRTGLSTGNIESPGVVFPRFTAMSIPVWQVARQCEHTCSRAFGLDMRAWALWMGKDGKINWSPGDETTANIPVIESNANLISHSPGRNSADMSRIETFMLPHLMHSMRFRIKDAKRGVEGEFRALKVEHELSFGRVRTFIHYGDDHERY